MRRRLREYLLATAAVLVVSPAIAGDVTSDRLVNADKEPQNWLMNHRTYDSQRYSPLARINKANIKDLKLAYAISVHKAQGCEVPVVVGVCHRSHSRMLTRPLLYTAITRARSSCVLGGDPGIALVTPGEGDQVVLIRWIAANDEHNLVAFALSGKGVTRTEPDFRFDNPDGRWRLFNAARPGSDFGTPSRQVSSRPARARSGQSPPSGIESARSSPPVDSCRRRRSLRSRASRAVLSATPWSQLPSNSGRWIAPARRARTRNVAWNTSSAACWSPTTWRQTRSTIGPCRCTRAVNATGWPKTAGLADEARVMAVLFAASVEEPVTTRSLPLRS